MLRVHVWPPEGNLVGHASLTFGTEYVSFWPETDSGKKDLKIKRSRPGAFIAALQQDIDSEGKRQPITITINFDIDEKKLEDYIFDLQHNVPKYQLARYNCSNVVADCLKVASGQKPSFRPKARSYGRLARIFGRGIWTPNEVLRYARELA
ncbi:MAG: hypothetical protein AAGB12_10245 [Pseudomonadota bacterium]